MSRRAARVGGSGSARPRRRVTWKVIPLVVIVAVVGLLVLMAARREAQEGATPPTGAGDYSSNQ